MSREGRDALVILARQRRQRRTNAQKLEQAVKEIFEKHGCPPTG